LLLLLFQSLLPSGAEARTAGVPDLHAAYDSLLGLYVDETGVRYEEWARSDHRFDLKDYILRLEAVEPDTLSRDEALAFWLNLYNAVTLEVVLDHYPIQSIRAFGVGDAAIWEKELVTVAGRPLTLNEIEHGIVRAEFQDPRIHFALNCAARSCPPLAPTAFTGAKLEEQLEAVTHAVVNDPAFVDISGCRTGRGAIRLNMIFEWYAADFEKDGKSVRDFLARYGPQHHRQALLDESCDLVYDDYDWALNDAPRTNRP
jgi:hypothetical protein